MLACNTSHMCRRSDFELCMYHLSPSEQKTSTCRASWSHEIQKSGTIHLQHMLSSLWVWGHNLCLEMRLLRDVKHFAISEQCPQGSMSWLWYYWDCNYSILSIRKNPCSPEISKLLVASMVVELKNELSSSEKQQPLHINLRRASWWVQCHLSW